MVAYRRLATPSASPAARHQNKSGARVRFGSRRGEGGGGRVGRVWMRVWVWVGVGVGVEDAC